MRLDLSLLSVAVLMSGGLPRNLSIDFSALPDGALPSALSGGTWSISSGKAVNTPSSGSNLYDSGKGTFDSTTEGWAAFASNTIASVAGELEVTYVDNSLGATNILSEAGDLAADIVPGFHELAYDAYESGGTFLFLFNTTSANFFHTIAVTSKTAKRLGMFLPTATQGQRIQSMAAGRIAYLDNEVLTKITPSELFAYPSNSYYQFAGDVTVRAALTVTTPSIGGVFCKLDSISNPQNYIIAFVAQDTNVPIQMYKVVSGVVTTLVTGGSYVAGAVLEIRCSGTNVECWYNSAQIGTTKTVSDAGITGNTLHGVLGTRNGAQVGSLAIVRDT